MKRINLLAFIFGSVLALWGCKPPPPPTPIVPPSNGFLVRSFQQDFVNGIPTAPPRVDPGIIFSGQWEFQSRPEPYVGTSDTCFGTTDFEGYYPCNNVKIPAVWAFVEFNGPCFGDGNILESTIRPGEGVALICIVDLRTFFVAPDTVDIYSPSQTIEMTGSGMDSTYGMPVLRIADANGDVIATTTASSISGDGSWVVAPMPYLGSVYSGPYLVVVSNVQPDGSLLKVGASG